MFWNKKITCKNLRNRVSKRVLKNKLKTWVKILLEHHLFLLISVFSSLLGCLSRWSPFRQSLSVPTPASQANLNSVKQVNLSIKIFKQIIRKAVYIYQDARPLNKSCHFNFSHDFQALCTNHSICFVSPHSIFSSWFVPLLNLRTIFFLLYFQDKKELNNKYNFWKNI